MFDRERERKCVCVCVCECIYIYIYRVDRILYVYSLLTHHVFIKTVCRSKHNKYLLTHFTSRKKEKETSFA